MSHRDAVYRGYTIRAEAKGRCWDVSVSPTRPDLPIILKRSFIAPNPDWENVIGETVHRIDQVLSVQSPAAPRGHSAGLSPSASQVVSPDKTCGSGQ
jgi:hypothetical protein